AAAAAVADDPELGTTDGPGLAGGAGKRLDAHVVGEAGHLRPALVSAAVFDPDLAVHAVDHRAASGVHVDLLARAGVGDPAGAVPLPDLEAVVARVRADHPDGAVGPDRDVSGQAGHEGDLPVAGAPDVAVEVDDPRVAGRVDRQA